LKLSHWHWWPLQKQRIAAFGTQQTSSFCPETSARRGQSRHGLTVALGHLLTDTMQKRLDHMPDAMAIRRRTVEHPFGTLKAWMGATHFLTKTLAKVKTEMSLHILAYNIKRMIQIFGIVPLIKAIRA
jgi:hypothetical protein